MIKEILQGIIADAYEEGYKKCLTDVVERSQFIYEVIAERARQDVFDDSGAIDIEEITKDEFDILTEDV